MNMPVSPTIKSFTLLFLLFVLLTSCHHNQSPPTPRYYDIAFPMMAYNIDTTRLGDSYHYFKNYALPPDTLRPYQSLDSFSRKLQRVSYDGEFHQTGFNSGRLYFWEHYGTNIDAPMHYVSPEKDPKKYKTIGEISMDQLIGPMVLLDLSKREDRNLHPEDIEPLINRLQNGAWLVVNFDMAKHYGTSLYSRSLQSPGVTAEACQYLGKLFDEGKIDIAGVAADNGSLDRFINFRDRNTFCHGELLSRGILILESLADLSELAKDLGPCEFIVAPLKIIGGSGSPVRVYVRCQ